MNERLTTLRDYADQVLGPRAWWQQQIPLVDRLRYIEAIADARANLFTVVNKVYPQLKGTTYSVTSDYIETLDAAKSSDAVDPVDGGVEG